MAVARHALTRSQGHTVMKTVMVAWLLVAAAAGLGHARRMTALVSSFSGDAGLGLFSLCRLKSP